MSGRNEHEGNEDEEVAVDATLVSDLASVEQAIDVYLKDPSVDVRKKLLDALERLDDQIDRSDAYGNSVIGSAALGYSSKGSVMGETSSASAAEYISESVLRAQTILIKAAKREVTTPTPETLVDLRAASQALAAERHKQVD